MTTNETPAADAAETTETTETTETIEKGGSWMSKREAVFRLLEISKNRDLDLDDVIAIQTAVRSLCKRIFDSERHFKRRRAAPESLANPPTEGATEEGDEGQQADDSKEMTGK